MVDGRDDLTMHVVGRAAEIGAADLLSDGRKYPGAPQFWSVAHLNIDWDETNRARERGDVEARRLVGQGVFVCLPISSSCCPRTAPEHERQPPSKDNPKDADRRGRYASPRS